MLAVHGQQFAACLLRRGHHQFSRGHQNFLVRERYGFSSFHCFVGGFQADDADGSRYHDVRVRVCPDSQHPFATLMDGRKRSDSLGAQRAGQFVGFLFITYGNYFRPMPFNLAGQFLEVAARGQRNDAKPLRQRFHDGKALPTNRAC